MSDNFEFSSYLSSDKPTRRHLHCKLCKLVNDIKSCEKRAKRILTIDIQQNLREIDMRMEKRGFKVFDGGLSDEIIDMAYFLAKLLKADVKRLEMVAAENAQVTMCFWFLIIALIGITIVIVHMLGW